MPMHSQEDQRRMTDTFLWSLFSLISSISVFHWTTESPFPLDWLAIEMIRSTCLCYLHYPSPVKGWMKQIAMEDFVFWCCGLSSPFFQSIEPYSQPQVFSSYLFECFRKYLLFWFLILYQGLAWNCYFTKKTTI